MDKISHQSRRPSGDTSGLLDPLRELLEAAESTTMRKLPSDM